MTIIRIDSAGVTKIKLSPIYKTTNPWRISTTIDCGISTTDLEHMHFRFWNLRE
jgi:hypothetical protein